MFVCERCVHLIPMIGWNLKQYKTPSPNYCHTQKERRNSNPGFMRAVASGLGSARVTVSTRLGGRGATPRPAAAPSRARIARRTRRRIRPAPVSEQDRNTRQPGIVVLLPTYYLLSPSYLPRTYFKPHSRACGPYHQRCSEDAAATISWSCLS